MVPDRPPIRPIPFAGEHRDAWFRWLQTRAAEDVLATADYMLRIDGWQADAIAFFLNSYADYLADLIRDSTEMAVDLWLSTISAAA